MSDTLQRLVAEFVRSFGLHDGETTPCGKPIPVSEAHALAELSGGEGLSQNDLARRLQLEKSTVSRLVASMERRGWLERRTDDADSRVRRLYLSPAGRRVAGEVEAARRDKFRRLAGYLGADEMQSVETGLRSLLTALRKEKEEGNDDRNENES